MRETIVGFRMAAPWSFDRHAPASHRQSRSSGGDRWRGAEVQMSVIDKSVDVLDEDEQEEVALSLIHISHRTYQIT